MILYANLVGFKLHILSPIRHFSGSPGQIAPARTSTWPRWVENGLGNAPSMAHLGMGQN